jgi:hypothetical protein
MTQGEPKTKVRETDAMTFVRAVSDPERRADALRVVALMQRATGEPPRLWGANIVGFGTYAYDYASGKTGEWPVVGFSPRKTELVLYLMAGHARSQALLASLGPHRIGKSCLYLKRLDGLDLAVLEALIRDAVAAMASKRVRAAKPRAGDATKRAGKTARSSIKPRLAAARKPAPRRLARSKSARRHQRGP